MAVFMSSCSSGPSESDAKEVVVDALGGCKLISLGSFDKTNGVADGGNKYQLAIKYSLIINPPENSAALQDKLVTEIKEAQHKVEQAQRDFQSLKDSAQKAIDKVNNGASTPEDVSARNDLMAQRDKAEELFKRLELDQLKKSSEAWKNFKETCANTDKSILASITKASAEFEAAHPGKDAFLSGFTADLTGTVNLVKTDNGWKQGL